MLYYHGTIKTAAEAIRREGLRPHREKTYDMMTFYGANMRDIDGWKPLVYLAKDKALANMYAHFRAAYEAAPYGTEVSVAGLAPFTKNATAIFNDEPVIVTVDLPTELESQVAMDWEETRGFTCSCEIDPAHILHIEAAGPDQAPEPQIFQGFMDDPIRDLLLTGMRMGSRYNDRF